MAFQRFIMEAILPHLSTKVTHIDGYTVYRGSDADKLHVLC